MRARLAEAGVVAVLLAALIVPMAGAVMFAKTRDSNWLVLMVPLFIFMEGAFALGPVMLLIAALLVEFRLI